MKKITAILVFSFFICYGFAQDCPEYNNLIRAGDRLLNREKYMEALGSYLAALRHCDVKMDDVLLKLKNLFKKINKMKERALIDRDSAEMAKNAAREMNDLLSHTISRLQRSEDELKVQKDEKAQYADSLRVLRIQIIQERDSVQKERVKELQRYAKLVDSVIGSKKNLDPITTNLQQIIAKENQTAVTQEKQRTEEQDNKFDSLYAGITAPEISTAPLTIQNDFLIGEGTSYVLTSNAGRRSGTAIKAIIIHATESSRRAAVSWFSNRNSTASTHIIIDTNGVVVQMVPFSLSAWHAGILVADSTIRKIFSGVRSPNAATIGIDLVGNAGKPFTEKQLQVCKTICALLKQQYKIEYLFTHSQTNTARNCPGPTFPIDEFRAEIFKPL